MDICKDGIALIVAGDDRNLGKLVYVMGSCLPDGLPQIGGQGEPRWHVQMLSSDLVGDDDEDYVAGSYCAANLMPIQVTYEVARSMREDAMMRFMDRVIAELRAEEDKPNQNTNDDSFVFVTDATKYRVNDRRAPVCEIPEWCARKLKERGLAEPIASHLLAGRFWWVNVDSAYSDDRREPGCCMVDDVAATEDIARILGNHFINVMAGPFNTRGEAQYAMTAAMTGQLSQQDSESSDFFKISAGQVDMPARAAALAGLEEDEPLLSVNSEIPIHLKRLPNVLEQLVSKGSEASWVVFMFNTKVPSGSTDDRAINLQYSIDGGVLGLDWVLLGERNNADKELLSKFIRHKGHEISEMEMNGVRYLRVEGDGLVELGSSIALDLYRIGKNYRLGLLCGGFCYRPPIYQKHLP